MDKDRLKKMKENYKVAKDADHPLTTQPEEILELFDMIHTLQTENEQLKKWWSGLKSEFKEAAKHIQFYQASVITMDQFEAKMKALKTPIKDVDYTKSWQQLWDHFNPPHPQSLIVRTMMQEIQHANTPGLKEKPNE